MLLGLRWDRRGAFGTRMRKQELVHLHGVLVEVTRSLVEQGAVSAEICNEYERLDVNANSIHAQKGDHREAVLLLATALGATLERPAEELSATSIR